MAGFAVQSAADSVPAMVASTSSRLNDRVCARLAAAVLVVAGVFYFWTAATIESYGSDTSTYYELARALRHEHRYWFNFAPHTMYPPGFPLLLAGLMSLVGESFAPLVKSLIFVQFAGLIALFYYVRIRRGSIVAAAIVTLVAMSGVLYFFSTVGLHSDGPYTTVSVAALLCYEIRERTTSKSVDIVTAVLAAVLVSYLILIRSIGVAFVIGSLLWMTAPVDLFARRSTAVGVHRVKRWGIVILVPLLVFAAWTVWADRAARAANVDYTQSYSQQVLKEDPHQIDSPPITIRTAPARAMRMLTLRTLNATRMVLNAPNIGLRRAAPFAVLLLVVLAVGYVRTITRESSVLEYYVAVYGAILLVYPYDEGMRYLLPIQPFILLYACDGVSAVMTRLSRVGRTVGSADWLRAPAYAVLFTALLAGGAYSTAGLATRNIAPDPTTFTNAPTIAVAKWIAAETAPDAVILDDQDAILHRLTRRRTLHFPLSTDPNVLAAAITTNRVAFVVVPEERQYEYYSPSPARRFADLMKTRPALFSPAFVTPGAVVYRVSTVPPVL